MAIPKQGEDWCHLPEEVGLVSHAGRWCLPAGPLSLDPGITLGGGVPAFPKASHLETEPVRGAGALSSSLEYQDIGPLFAPVLR